MAVEVFRRNQYTLAFNTLRRPLNSNAHHGFLAGLFTVNAPDRPVGTLLLLWPTLAALVMAADGLPPLI